MMTMFFPLFNFLILIGIIFFIAKIFMNRTSNKTRKYVYSRRVRWIFGIYIGVLVFCMIVDLFLPAKGTSDWKRVDPKAVEKESLELYDAAVEGRIADVGKKFIVTQWEFAYDKPILVLSSHENRSINTQIIVERKNVNDDKVEAAFYRTRANMNNLDITSLSKAPSLEIIEDDHVLSIKSELTKIKIAQFFNAFPVTQFTGEKMFDDDTSISPGQSILYLRIPKGLQLDNKSVLNVVYINNGA